jgi:hypothetical protein
MFRSMSDKVIVIQPLNTFLHFFFPELELKSRNLLRAILIRFTLSYPFPLRPVLILSSSLRLQVRSGLFDSGFED